MKLQKKDPALFALVEEENARQNAVLEMIASESVQPAEALALAGSCFNNKTAVGMIGHQRLQGSQVADKLEALAAERAREIFGADYANMTPYSGSMANFCAYAAFLSPGDKVLALDPVAGSHQSHGGKNNITSKLYQFAYFGLCPDTGLIDYDSAARLAREFCPKLIVIGSAAYPRRIDYERLAKIAHENGAVLMVDVAHFTGLIAAGVSDNPVPFADVVTASTTKTMCGPHSGFIMCRTEYAQAVEKSIYPGHVASLHLQTIAAMAYALENSKTDTFRQTMRQVVANAKRLCAALEREGFGIFTGGTDCHLLLVDLRPFGLDGEVFAKDLNEVGITVNSKGIPFSEPPYPCGIRVGTTVLTQRGMKEEQMDEVARLFGIIARAGGSEDAKEQVRAAVAALVRRFPLPD